MNVILVNPKLRTWSPNVYAPLGIAYIASALENEGYKVNILDLNSHKVSDSKLKEQASSADVIGIGGMITEYQEVVRLTQVVRDANPKAKIILGGALATTWTERVLKNSQADIAVVGEGEETAVEMFNAIREGSGYETIKGIAYKNDGKIKANPIADPITDLDTISFPARHLLEMDRYTTHHLKSFGIKVNGEVKSATMISSRGCPYQCVFCFREVGGNKWRGRSPDNVIKEIKQLRSEYGFNGFVFNDDTFVMNRRRVMEFCDKVIAQKLDIQWYCQGRINLMDEELIKSMANAGCRGIAYGIESGNQQILDFIKKRITIEQIEKITRLTKKYGIHVTGYFMIGMLGETRETIKQTFDFARKLDLDFYSWSITTPMMGTALYRMAQEKGLVSGDLDDWSLHASTNLTLDCTKKDLERFNSQAFREFTMQKRWGKHYLLNPLLWWQGFQTIAFLVGKRSYGILLKKVWGVVFGG